MSEPLKVGDSVILMMRKGMTPFNVTRIMGDYCSLTSADLRWTRSPVSTEMTRIIRDEQREELIRIAKYESRTK